MAEGATTTYRIDLGYDGTGFHGFASQRNVRTVQGELDTALRTLIGETVDTTCAGRTDTGVHALGQVVSFRTPADIDTERLRRGIGGIVGPEIAVWSVTEVDSDFDARFSAKCRSYKYFVETGSANDPLRRNWTWHVGKDLDIGAMAKVAAAFVGEHDFASFCRTHQGRTTTRTVEEASWTVDGSRLTFSIKAAAFCHQMVRSLVGYSVEVGLGRVPASGVNDVIEARDRAAARNVAPPTGLVLWEVGYEEDTPRVSDATR